MCATANNCILFFIVRNPNRYQRHHGGRIIFDHIDRTLYSSKSIPTIIIIIHHTGSLALKSGGTTPDPVILVKLLLISSRHSLKLIITLSDNVTGLYHSVSSN
jgi:hypothetical protein